MTTNLEIIRANGFDMSLGASLSVPSSHSALIRIGDHSCDAAYVFLTRSPGGEEDEFGRPFWDWRLMDVDGRPMAHGSEFRDVFERNEHAVPVLRLLLELLNARADDELGLTFDVPEAAFNTWLGQAILPLVPGLIAQLDASEEFAPGPDGTPSADPPTPSSPIAEVALRSGVDLSRNVTVQFARDFAAATVGVMGYGSGMLLVARDPDSPAEASSASWTLLDNAAERIGTGCLRGGEALHPTSWLLEALDALVGAICSRDASRLDEVGDWFYASGDHEFWLKEYGCPEFERIADDLREIVTKSDLLPPLPPDNRPPTRMQPRPRPGRRVRG